MKASEVNHAPRWQCAINPLAMMMPKLLPSAVALVLALAGCAESDQAPSAGTAGTTREIYVASQRVPCVGVGPMECLQVRERPDQPWQLFYDEIEGFEFKPGTEYRLRIVEEPVQNPPADASAIHTRLDKVLEQRKAR